MPGRADHLIVCHRIAAGVVQVVRPLVDVVGSWFDCFDPAIIPGNHRHTLGSQYTQDFLHLHFSKVGGDDEIEQIIDVRKALAVETTGTNRSVLVGSGQLTAITTDDGCIGIEAVHLIAFGSFQGCGEFTISYADVNDQSPLNAGLFENLIGGLLRCCRMESRQVRDSADGGSKYQ